MARSTKPKAPKGCYWRGDTLWGRSRIKGKLVRWSLHTDNPKIAAARREAGKEFAVAEVYHGDARYSFADALEAWSNQIERLVGSPKTAARYLGSMKQLRPFLEGKALTQVNVRLLSEIVEARRDGDVTDATIKRDLNALSSVMRYAAGRGWVETNPVPGYLELRQVKEKKALIVLPRDGDIALVKQRGPAMIGHAIDAALCTGAREDELVRALRPDIDHDRKQLTLIGKRNKRRTIDISVFGGYERLTSIPAHGKSKQLIWHDEGEAYSTFATQFYRLVEQTIKWTEDEGVDFQKFTFHALRHRHAIDWLKSGRSIYDLQYRLGHSSVATTEVYLRAGFLTEDEVRRVKFGVAPRAAAIA